KQFLGHHSKSRNLQRAQVHVHEVGLADRDGLGLADPVGGRRAVLASDVDIGGDFAQRQLVEDGAAVEVVDEVAGIAIEVDELVAPFASAGAAACDGRFQGFDQLRALLAPTLGGDADGGNVIDLGQ